MEEDWVQGVVFKSSKIIEAIKENLGEVILFCDVDIQFFKPVKDVLQKAIEGKDIVCQLDDPGGNLCTGFFVMRCSDKTLKLWEDVREAAKKEKRDQMAFNRFLREREDIKYGTLPRTYFGGGTFLNKVWKPGKPLYVPLGATMHHANWVHQNGVKIEQLKYVRGLIKRGPLFIVLNNIYFTLYKWAYLTLKALKKKRKCFR